MKIKILSILLLIGFGATSFVYLNSTRIAKPADEIKLTASEASTDFPKAAIKNFDYKIDGDSIAFNYQLSDYVLGSQTADASTKMCANSAKGQHIHLILNNLPYEAWYLSSFKKKLAEGHYVALSFLSRSYHESIKKPSAFVLKQFNVGKNAGTKIGDINLKQPLLFYSRPKGEYVGNDTKKILLDFYVVNAELKSNGFKVRATINGKEFMITDWKPYYIEGLPMGENIIKLELLNKSNQPASKDLMFQTIERKIVLKEK